MEQTGGREGEGERIKKIEKRYQGIRKKEVLSTSQKKYSNGKKKKRVAEGGKILQIAEDYRRGGGFGKRKGIGGTGRPLRPQGEGLKENL